MAKFRKKGSEVIISDFNERELYEMLKFDIPLRLSFINEESIEINYINVGERSFDGHQNIVEVQSEEETGQISYARLIGLLTKYYAFGVLYIVIDKYAFEAKEGLFVLLGKLNEELINSCIKLSYDNKNEYYSVINRPGDLGESNKLYYFELNDSVLFFGKEGPQLITGRYNSVTDVLVF